ncbi:MAG: hypothetical protein DWQ47_13710 [Acidobacteria bacterium]|nr:MAG: hypothetical protein DWQ32_01110 [Acidobacteriota bacterium]REK02870.1 MAG: hypothetical protein DWQ38_11025 [Acidobacteriota bacterium]REK13326.1 MAG: hypothetical protein DWQ43_06800 [Acidobacteriota bacterium]REK41320.1 MAG: hypothetical protein DWQ47_13710 [Acidobacteriota bacterium]
MNCRDFHVLLDSYLSDELLTETNHDILRHLEDCQGCRSAIEARRLVRTRLRSAVRTAPEFEVSASFKKRLQSELSGGRSRTNVRSGSFGWLNVTRGWALAAAGVLLIFSVGVFFTYTSGDDPGVAAGTEVLRTDSLPPDHLVNIAAVDHENCAVKHFADDPATTVAEVPSEFRGLAQVVSSEMKGLLKDCDLVDSHSCGYKGVKFSHVIMKNGGRVLSVLVTGESADPGAIVGRVKSFASPDYTVSSFDVAKRSVLVVSELDAGMNAEAAQLLAEPLKLHYERPRSEAPSSTALLLAR